MVISQAGCDMDDDVRVDSRAVCMAALGVAAYVGLLTYALFAPFVVRVSAHGNALATM